MNFQAASSVNRIGEREREREREREINLKVLKHSVHTY